MQSSGGDIIVQLQHCNYTYNRCIQMQRQKSYSRQPGWQKLLSAAHECMNAGKSCC